MKTFTLTATFLAFMGLSCLTGCSMGDGFGSGGNGASSANGTRAANGMTCGLAHGDGRPACQDPTNPGSSNK